MSTPTLVIGLGGTGLKTATHVKKNVWESNKNQPPKEMALMVLDTEKDIKYTAGGWGQERGAEHATGPVKIDIGEYIAMTGNVRATGEEIKIEQYRIESNPGARRNQPFRHMSSWFQARYYLEEANVPEQIWNLDEGAGRYRQFGRLALFRNIDTIEQKLKSAIQAVQRASQNQTLYVHIVGSLAGGTGAALYADVAHLVQLICKDAGYTQAPVILGHFVLTEAFRGTRAVKLNESGVLQNFNARMFAGLRELTRLQSPIIRRSGGYPLVYDPNGKGTRNSLLPGMPYDAVYLYDGVADRIQLNQQPIENGLAPAIADLISAYIDEKSGGAFRSHAVNIRSFYTAYNIPVGAVTYGSVGAFTIELPIYHITEGWAHRLAGEVLDTLLAPDPQSLDKDTGVPARLLPNTPGGREAQPQTEAENWLRTNATALVSKIADWGQRATQTEMIRNQVSGEILALTAEGWQTQLAPTDPRFGNYVVEAQAELNGSLADKTSDKYYIDHGRLSGGSDSEKALNLQRDVDDRLRQMVGDSADIWKRTGGDFRKALVRLGNHHVQEFETSLLKFVRDSLNGAEVGNAEQQKGGKLGFVLAFLTELEKDLAGGAQILALADRQSQSQRRPTFDGIDDKRTAAFAKLQKGAGIFGGNAKEYRDSSNELAQFQKADIARQVVYDLAGRLHKGVDQLLEEARLWERILATSIADNGGAYGLIRRGKSEVESDRRASQNAVRWVIADDEAGDKYISSKYAVYAMEDSDANVSKRDEILSKIEWKVGRVDGRGDMRIDFTLDGGQPWSREAGQKDAMKVGQRNIGRLLTLCRQPFEQAWSDMSVTSYLYQNYYEGANELEKLAQRIHSACDYLLDLSPLKETPTMRTAFVRVYQDKLDTRGETFLRDLRAAVNKQFNVSSTAEQLEYINDKGQPSTDPFKITFLVYGDLLLPDEIKAFGSGRAAYRQFSGGGEQWKELQMFPADTNALQIERELDNFGQSRREFDPDVVTVMEDMGNFQTAMRCLAFGEPDYHWGIGGKTGLLLHEYTPPQEENAAGHSYWRLVLMPEGTLGGDGKTVYDQYGSLARPMEYKLSPMQAEPSLLEAFIQLISRQADYDSGTRIDWIRIEDTLQKAMIMHRDQWDSVEAMGYRLQPKKEAHLQGELKDKAAQIVRLNALLTGIDEDLARNRWAWAKGGGNIPPRIDQQPDQKVKIRKSVDMLTAIRGAAEQEIINLNRRLNQIGARFGETPTERLVITSSYRPVAEYEPPAAYSPPAQAPGQAPQTTYTPTPAADTGYASTYSPPVSEPVAPPMDYVAAESVEAPGTSGDDYPPGTWFCSNCERPNEPGTMFCTSCGADKPANAREIPAAPKPSVEPAAPAPSYAATPAPEPVAPEPAPAAAAAECLNGHPMQPGWILCPMCGAAPRPKSPRCANGHDLQPGWILCPICGAAPAN